MSKLRYALMWSAALVVLIVMNSLIYQKDQLTTNGQVVFLELSPRDPRSLMQGDYMWLDYAIARNQSETLPTDGYLALQLDATHVARAIALEKS